MMSDAEVETQRERIRACLDRWREPLGLDEWQLDLVYQMGVLSPDGQPQSDSGAYVKAWWQYRRASITFRIDDVADWDDDHLEEVVVHEAMHVLLHEMREWRDDSNAIAHEERVATGLARAFIRTRGAS